MKKKILNILLSITVLFALFYNIRDDIHFTTISLFSIIIFLFINKINIKLNRNIIILSLIFSLIFIFGDSYVQLNNWNLIFGSLLNFGISIIRYIGYFVIFSYIISICYKYLDKFSDNNKDVTIKNKIYNLFVNHPFIFSFIFIIVCWLIYIIAFYPAILSPDPSYQIKQFLGEYTKYMDYIIPIDKSVTITNHHPVIHTLLLGSCVKIGMLIGNDNLGFFIYSIIQILIMSLTLSYTIKYMFKINTPKKYIILCLLIYSLVPAYALYSMSSVKDVLFTCFIILFNLLLFDINKNNDKLNIKKIVIFILIMILVILFRNNGIYVILLSILFLIILNKNRRKLGIIIFISMFIFNFSYTNIVLPYFKISDGSIREVLSIPFQQTARYVKYNSDIISDDEKKAIDKILDYDTLASRYDPDISDDVKNKFNKYATNEDLINYFKAWFKGLMKRPNTYIQATINNTYGYFYPNKTRWYIYHNYYNILDDNGIDYHYNNLSGLRNALSKVANGFREIPVVGSVVNIGFNGLLLIFMLAYLIHNKKNILFLIPSFVSLLVCIASPVNTYFRYAMPYVFSMPLLIALFLYNIKK